MAEDSESAIDIDHLQRLVRLDLGRREQQLINQDLEQLKQSVDRLGDVELSDVQPAFQPVDIEAGQRVDEPDEPLSVDETMANVPARHHDYVRVPAAISRDDDAE